MTGSLILAAVWVVCSTIVAFLPMRHQYIPGVALLIAAPLIIVLLTWTHGWVAGAVSLFGFVSMFRNPLRFLWRKWRGEDVEVPK